MLHEIKFQYTIDEVENLIKKHEAFEKAATAQEERFAALERLTTVSINKKLDFKKISIFVLLFQFELKEIKRRQEEDERRHHEDISRVSATSQDRPDAGERSGDAGSAKSSRFKKYELKRLLHETGNFQRFCDKSLTSLTKRGFA